MLKNLELYTGAKIPNIGLGTWMSEPGEVKAAVECSIDVGYRHIDCAYAYLNENEVGDGLKTKFDEGKVKREDVFVTSKLWNSFHKAENVPKGLKETMDNLKLDYLDLFLVHWPVSYKVGNMFPDESVAENEYDDVDHLETWKAMEELVDSKKVKAIGLSNFSIQQIQHILDNCRIKPAVLQVEVSVYWPNTELVEFCQKNGIVVTAYSPLGSFPPNDAPADAPRLLTDPVVTQLASQHSCTPAQIVISYILERGIICIPKSIKPARILENYRAIDVKLSAEDMGKLNNVQIKKRAVYPKAMMNHKDFAFEK